MSNSERMKAAIERDIKAITLRPSVARGSERMTVVAKGDGLCTVTDGDDSLKVDLGKAHGGNGTTPGPGFLVRAALGSCLTQACLCWAAYFGVPINQISLEIHTEDDATAALGMDSDVTCGYTGIRIAIDIDSPASRAEIEHVVETAERRDFMYANLAEEHPVKLELRISSSAAA
jgi:uncharacterized OsmC-like protein